MGASKNRCHGFTLIELMIVVALLSIIALVAIPSFSSFISKNRVSAKTDEVISLLNYAKSMAVLGRASYTVSFDNDGVVTVSSKSGEVSRRANINENGVYIDSSPESLTYISTGFVTDGGGEIVICSGGAGNKIDLSKSGVVNKSIYNDCE